MFPKWKCSARASRKSSGSPATQYAPRPQAPEAGPAYAIGMDPQRESYRYTGNDTYLNEAGRDSDHLYVAPRRASSAAKKIACQYQDRIIKIPGINDIKFSELC